MAAWFDLDVPLDLPEGAIAGAEADGRRLAVVRLGAEWRVFADTCTHAHCPFTGSARSRTVR
jgi:nitrite reductase/ring-hydroxylating ferredoxin subunit